MPNVLVVGGVSYDTIIHVDHFPEPSPQTLFSKDCYQSVGSTGAGKALNLAKLGFDTALHTPLGDDEFGYRIREFFDHTSVRLVTDHDPLGTKTHTNLMDSKGGRISIFTAYGSHEPEIDGNLLENHVMKADYIVLNIINYVRNVIPIVKKHNKNIWVDIHDYDGKNPYHQDFIDAADFLFLSSERLANYQSFMREMIAMGKQLVVCTHGEEGATALTKEYEWIRVDAISVETVVDTNGAGDSFFAGVMYGIESGASIESSMKMGAKTASMCVLSKQLVHELLAPNVLK